VHFCPHLCAPRKTFRLVTHPEIAPSQALLTPKFFAVGHPEKKVYIGGIGILSILVSLEPVFSTCMTLHRQKERKRKSSRFCFNYYSPSLFLLLGPLEIYHEALIQFLPPVCQQSSKKEQNRVCRSFAALTLVIISIGRCVVMMLSSK
jgi:hypothetical protein